MEFILSNREGIVYGLGLASALILFLPFCPLTIDLTMVNRNMQLGIYKSRHLLWTIVYLGLGLTLFRGYAALSADHLLYVSAVSGFLGGILGSSDAGWFQVAWITAAMTAMMFWGGYVPYVMTPPKNQKLLDIPAADELISDDEVILGLELDGEVRAYPRNAIARPHYFTETVAGTPLTISYCILCNSGMAFKNELDGKPMNLKCVTAYNNNIIYYDPATDNYVQQLDGKIFNGPDTGKELEAVPVIQSSWGEWKKIHPSTKLYYAPSLTFRDKMMDWMLGWMIPIEKLSKRNSPWHRVSQKPDDRLPAMSFVLGVEVNEDTAAYAVKALKEDPVVNDTVGGEAIAVFYNAAHDVSAVFSRNLDGQTLTFEASGGGETVARDQETGSSWDVTGRAIEGTHAGKKLTAIPHYNRIFWFGWSLFKPDTRVKVPAAA